MRILALNSHNNSYKKNLANKREINFKNNSSPFVPLNFISQDEFKQNPAPILQKGQILDYKNRLFNRTTTFFARQDISWTALADYFYNRFLNDEKVNVYNWGSSVGKEAYTLSILFDSYFKNSKKFLPIDAYDIDFDIIQKAKNMQKNGFKLTTEDFTRLRIYLSLNKKDTGKYFKSDKRGGILLSQKTLEPVNFECANIFDSFDKINSTMPSIVFARNMWPYIDSDKYKEAAQELFSRMKKGSVLVIGAYDCKGELGNKTSNEFPLRLKEVGFEGVDIAKGFDCYLMDEDVCLVFEKN